MARRRRNQGRGRAGYIVVAVVVLLAVAAVGYYLYGSSQSGNSSTSNNSSTGCPSTAPAGPNVYACVQTTQGSFELELYAALAPKTVANFVSLVDSHFYDHLVWHRIVKGFAIQTGDPTSRYAQGNPANWGSGGSSTTIPLEIAPSLNNNVGYIAMARSSDPNSATSQWFVNLANNVNLNGQYAVFGQVISGMDVVNSIANLPVAASCASTGGLTCPPTNPSNAEVISITIIPSA